MLGKRALRFVAIGLLIFLPAAAAAASYQVRNDAGGGAIDTLTINDNFASRATSPQASEMIIFQTNVEDSPETTRNRIVTGGAGLENFIVSPSVQADQFIVTDSSGGNPNVLLNGQLITTDPDGVTAHSGQNFIQVPSQIPTLTEWGLIIFAALLLASLVWFIRRRRKLARV